MKMQDLKMKDQVSGHFQVLHFQSTHYVLSGKFSSARWLKIRRSKL